MSTIRVQGITSLKGEIKIQGSKNAVLPMMAASILHSGTTVIANVPRIQDVFCMMGILEYMGCACRLDGQELTIDASVLTSASIPEVYVRSMRSSIMVLGALLGRMGEGVTRYPGGCSIGKRPIDLHLYALRALGARIREEDGVITASAFRLKGTEIELTFPSVGATENALLAAVLAEGVTVIRGAAREPEIAELCGFLNNMGARIRGAGTATLTVTGVVRLHDSVFCVAGDRIVAGTYLAAAMAATGEAVLTGIVPSHMEAVLDKAEQTGAQIKRWENAFQVTARERPRPTEIITGPYPGFPTDLQSPMLAALSLADGESRVRETIFEGRFETVRELRKLGADIIIEKETALVSGRYPLKGAAVKARDLRGGAALVVAGLAAEGETTVQDCYHIERGYEDICRDLKGLGAVVRG